MSPRRSRLRRQLATAFRWSVHVLSIAGWAMAPATLYIPLGLVANMYPAPRYRRAPTPEPEPVLPGHPDRLDLSPPTDVERRLWAAALTES